MIKTIDAIFKPVGKPLQYVKYKDDLTEMQKLIGGYVQSVFLPENIVMWVDEEGLMKELPLNIITYVEGKQVHEIVGNVLFTGIDRTNGETASLTTDQKMWLATRLKFIATATNDNQEYSVFGLIVR
jgi:hypothetical protein